jgi:cation-transporting ATPase 13A2
LNIVNLENKTFVKIFIEHLFLPLNVYYFISITIWFYTEYYSFAAIVLFMILIILFVISYQSYSNHRKILSFSLNMKCNVVRNMYLDNCQNLSNEVKSTSLYIVPGDIIELKSGDLMPCDAIILDG